MFAVLSRCLSTCATCGLLLIIGDTSRPKDVQLHARSNGSVLSQSLRQRKSKALRGDVLSDLTSQDVPVTQAPTVIDMDTHDELLRGMQQMMRPPRPGRHPRLAPGERDVQIAVQMFRIFCWSKGQAEWIVRATFRRRSDESNGQRSMSHSCRLLRVATANVHCCCG